MTANHARANDVARLQDAVAPVRLKRHDALKILADEQQELLVDAINRFADVTTYAVARQVVDTEPCYKLLCETCGWTLDMICPECPGCGCYSGECDGWRHGNYVDDISEHGFEDDDYDYDYDYEES